MIMCFSFCIPWVSIVLRHKVNAQDIHVNLLLKVATNKPPKQVIMGIQEQRFSKKKTLKIKISITAITSRIPQW